MKYKDMKQAVNLLENEWNLGEKEKCSKEDSYDKFKSNT